ncbi:MAG: hydantoinase/oxoprolinase family protein [Aestuariivirga sp.]
MTETSYVIGVDTGGTYTDAAVIDLGQHRILSSAKAITTKGDLSIGVIEAMAAATAQVKGFVPSRVQIVSVSTTLATNAVVEGHGGAVGLVLVGFDAAMEERSGLAKAFPTMPILRLAGGHDHIGAEVAKLDLATLKPWLAGPAGDVSAFAVVASFAVRNGGHEVTLGEALTQATGKPVTLSHHLASALNAPRRAQTAVLNARLVSRIVDLKKAVEAAMAQQKLLCPLMFVKGDGSLAKAEIVAARPIETVLSGPAASLVGAQWLSGLDSFIMSDMGGTTTDVGLLIDGRPQVAEQGAEIGGWRTMVKAIDVKTIGLGGDSEVHFGTAGSIELGPERAVPIALLAARYPDLVAMLEADLAETTGGSQLGKFLVLPFGAQVGAASIALLPKESEVLAQISSTPVPLRKVAMGTVAARAVASLRKKGLIQYSALTPSDAAHVLGLQNNWNGVAARHATALALRFRDMKVADDAALHKLSSEIWNAAVAKTARVILDQAFGASLNNALIDAVASGEGRVGHVGIKLSPQMPIVAVGGPVRIYYPEVGKRLACEVIFTPHCEVANAVGAAAGLVACKVAVQVDGDGNGLFRVTGQGPVLTFTSGTDALAKAVGLAETAALAMAQAQGTQNAKVKHEISKDYLPDAKDENGLLSAVIVAEARGLPHTS